MSNIEYLSGEYNKGFTAGIKAIQDIIKYIQPDLKHHHKKLTPKLLEELLDICITNRERIRESVDGFVRYNDTLEKFEFYEPAQNRMKQLNMTCETCGNYMLNDKYNRGWCSNREFSCTPNYSCKTWVPKEL